MISLVIVSFSSKVKYSTYILTKAKNRTIQACKWMDRERQSNSSIWVTTDTHKRWHNQIFINSSKLQLNKANSSNLKVMRLRASNLSISKQTEQPLTPQSRLPQAPHSSSNHSCNKCRDLRVWEDRCCTRLNYKSTRHLVSKLLERVETSYTWTSSLPCSNSSSNSNSNSNSNWLLGQLSRSELWDRPTKVIKEDSSSIRIAIRIKHRFSQCKTSMLTIRHSRIITIICKFSNRSNKITCNQAIRSAQHHPEVVRLVPAHTTMTISPIRSHRTHLKTTGLRA